MPLAIVRDDYDELMEFHHSIPTKEDNRSIGVSFSNQLDSEPECLLLQITGRKAGPIECTYLDRPQLRALIEALRMAERLWGGV